MIPLEELRAQNDVLSSITDPLSAAQAVLAYGQSRFDTLKIASSFSVEDIALMHLASVHAQKAEVFTLDTGRLHEETYALMDEVRALGLSFKSYAPEREALEALTADQGHLGFRKSIEARKTCCAVRKLGPLARALDGADAWATGLRRAQGPTRAALLPLELDVQNGLVKLNPLFLFEEEDAWAYVRAHDLPSNPLHDQGYPSIGCAPCTRAVQPGEDARAGRWWWERPEQKECGLHVNKPPVSESEQLNRRAS